MAKSRSKAAASARPTVADVARACGLSTATVSRALSLPPEQSPVRAATRRRVLRVAEKMGYRPNWLARAFAKGKTHSIGLLYTRPLPVPQSLYSEMIHAFSETLQDRGYQLLFVPATSQTGLWEDMLREQRLDGLAAVEALPPNVAAALGKAALPAVLLNVLSDLAVPQVRVDDRDAAGQMTGHLLQLGHQSIVYYVPATAGDHYSVGHRREGYEQAMRAAGLASRIRSFVATRDEVGEILAASVPRPTAVLAYSDWAATELLQALWMKGLRVPQDLSVVGFDNTFPAEFLIPPLTTFALPSFAMGRMGAQLLLDRIEHGPSAAERQQVELKGSLVLRSSTAPASTPPGKRHGAVAGTDAQGWAPSVP